MSPRSIRRTCPAKNVVLENCGAKREDVPKEVLEDIQRDDDARGRVLDPDLVLDDAPGAEELARRLEACATTRQKGSRTIRAGRLPRAQSGFADARSESRIRARPVLRLPPRPIVMLRSLGLDVALSRSILRFASAGGLRALGAAHRDRRGA